MRSVIKSAFPGRDELVDRGLREDATFRDLCRDYRQCAVALERWSLSSDAASASRIQEYAEILDDLSAEIRSWLDSLQARWDRPDGKGAR